MSSALLVFLPIFLHQILCLTTTFEMEATSDYRNPLYVETTNFYPALTGEEVCRALGPVSRHFLAVLPKGRDAWEIHVSLEDVRDVLEVEGLTIRGRHCEVTRRFPSGTWVRMRGIPLYIPNDTVNLLMKPYGEVIVGSSHATWRNTTIKTGDRTFKIKLARDIPGKVRYDAFGWVSFRYRNQPEVCFVCGQSGHQQWECPQKDEANKTSYAGAIKTPAPALAPLTPTDESEPNLDTSNGEERGEGEDHTESEKKKKEKKDKKKERKERKREYASPENTPEKEVEARHEGLPTLAPVMQLKVRKT